MITDPLFYAAACPAVILMGLSKGGFAGVSALALPVLALVISPIQAAAIMLPILIVQDVVSVWSFRRTWDGRTLTIMLPGALIGIGLGYLLAAKVSDGAIELVVGIICIAFGLRSLLRRGPALTEPSPGSVPGGVFWGMVSGFASFIANSGGPTFQVYVLPQRLPRDVLVGTTAIFFAIMNWIKVPPYMALGQFTHENLTTTLVLVPLAIVSTIAGVWLVRQIAPERFYRIIYTLLVLVGCKLLWDGMHLPFFKV